MEEFFLPLLKEYGYIILFIWSVLEGELGLIFAGIMAHTGDFSLPIAIFVAGIGGFAGDQFFFYLGRKNKTKLHKRLHNQRRKFAVAHLLLKRHGWPIIFAQRYMYGFRTIIPISIGLTQYSAKKFMLINLVSAWCWASITILPAYYMGEHILIAIDWLNGHKLYAIPLVAALWIAIIASFKKAEESFNKKRHPARKP